MTNIQNWCWLLLLVLAQSVHSIFGQAQFMSFCNQTLNFSSSSLSIMYTPSSYSSCCNITLIKSLSDLSEQITINILNMSTINSSLRVSNKQTETIEFHSYSSLNRTYLKSDILLLPITLSLCQFNVQSFEILITNISKGPCKSNQYICSTNNQDQWCIDETYHCDGYHSCPQGMDERGCTKSRSVSSKPARTIRGGIVTTIFVFGLLLIICSVSIALGFIYFRRKHQRRQRHLTYSLESTSDDWEPSGTGYRLFDNSTNNRRHNIDNVIIDTNEHMPIATNMTIR